MVKSPPKTKKMSFSVPLSMTPERARDYFCCIADLYSRMPALEYSDGTFKHQLLYPKAVFPPYITILNSTLYHNPSIKLPLFLYEYYEEKKIISRTLSTCVGLISGSLRKDPKIARLHLKRSKSFHDMQSSHYKQLPHHLSLRRAHSCPDLSGIHLMHPKLHGTVMTSATGMDIEEEDEVPVGLHKCKKFILYYWTDTVPSTISEDL